MSQDVSDTCEITRLYLTGAEPADIAEALRIPLQAVQTKLVETSPKYRRTVAKAQSAAPADVAEEMLGIIVAVARDSQNELVQLSAAKFARDDLKGRRDANPTDELAAAKLAQVLEVRALAFAQQRRAFFGQSEPVTIDVAS